MYQCHIFWQPKSNHWNMEIAISRCNWSFVAYSGLIIYAHMKMADPFLKFCSLILLFFFTAVKAGHCSYKITNVTQTGLNRTFVGDYFQMRINTHLVV